jgi:hypothetical protein
MSILFRQIKQCLFLFLQKKCAKLSNIIVIYDLWLGLSVFLSCVNSLPFYVKMNGNYVRNTSIVILIVVQHHMSIWWKFNNVILLRNFMMSLEKSWSGPPFVISGELCHSDVMLGSVLYIYSVVFTSEFIQHSHFLLQSNNHQNSSEYISKRSYDGIIILFI